MHEAPDKLKVLFICHNHQSLFPGGTEAYALELYEEMRGLEDVEPFFLARVGQTDATQQQPEVGAPAHLGTPFGLLDSDTHQMSFHTERAAYDPFIQTMGPKSVLTQHFHNFLLALQPDVVHVQHTHYLGMDILRAIRNTLPDAPILYTLHEYLPICHRDGVMVRTVDERPCTHSSPRRCHECFPAYEPGWFFLRKRFAQSQFALVDLFLAPSDFLIEKYVDWGIPRERILKNEHGRKPAKPLEPAERRPARNQLGYFGQINAFKGTTVLLKAMNILAAEAETRGADAARDPHLRLHGANLEKQSESFQQEFRESLDSTGANVTWVGRYDEHELPMLMAEVDWVVMPSVWWENCPRVIQEAFQHHRPVICSGIGAMAEKVTDGVNGLHFRVGDSDSLTQTIRRAVSSQELWGRLKAGIPEVRSIGEEAQSLLGIYRELLREKVAA
jgi:glycosyltransferase involved in cell wall biosynthesis